MKKITVYFLFAAFAALNIFASCEEEMEERNKRFDKSKCYFKKYNIFDDIDSTNTKISVYVGIVDGHKYKYHLFEGKNKSQMEVEHLKNECKACNK